MANKCLEQRKGRQRRRRKEENEGKKKKARWNMNEREGVINNISFKQNRKKWLK